MSDIENKFQDLSGKAKEGIGEATGNESLSDEGRADQVKADIAEKVEDAKDAVSDGVNKVIGSVKDALNKD